MKKNMNELVQKIGVLAKEMKILAQQAVKQYSVPALSLKMKASPDRISLNKF